MQQRWCSTEWCEQWNRWCPAHKSFAVLNNITIIMLLNILLFAPIVTACIDFSNFKAGDVVSDLGDGVRVEGDIKPRKLQPDMISGDCMIFDSANPTGGDYDLGTPNRAFGGPGRGRAGGSSNFANSDTQGNVLILSEDGDSTDPDDNQNGGRFRFYFDPPRYIETLGLLDTEAPVRIKVYTKSGMTEIRNSGRGNNSFDRVFIGLPDVRKITVKVLDSAAITDINCPARPVCEPDVKIKFENFRTGAAVSDLGYGIGVTANRYTESGLELADAMVFNSSAPTGGDFDLGTPHRSFGGLGRGNGGRQGQPFENDKARGQVLIISEDNDRSDPDDEAAGGVFQFTFARPLYVHHLGLLDNEEGAQILITMADGKTTDIIIPERANNSMEVVQIQLPAVIGMSLELNGSAALTHLKASTCQSRS